MVDTRTPKLIGPIVTTRMVDGRGFFIGPLYSYLLAILGSIFSWNIIAITKFLLLMWWSSALLLTVWVARQLNWSIALLVYLLLATHPTLVGYSHMVLNPNFLALFSIGFFFFLFRAFSHPSKANWFLTGLFTGICLSFNYLVLSYFGLIALVWLYQIYRRRARIIDPLVIGFGIILGNLPFFIFELRHNFYNLRTILDLGVSPGGGASLIAGYTLFAFLPLAVWIFAYFAEFLRRRIGFLVPLLLTLILVFYFQTSTTYSRTRGIGMPKGWSVPLQQQLAYQICQDNHGEPFEIAAMVTADIRAMDLRWFVQQCAQPAGFTQYPFVDTLYLVDQGFLAQGIEPGNWEIASFAPFAVRQKQQLNQYLWFYKLERLKPSSSPAL